MSPLLVLGAVAATQSVHVVIAPVVTPPGTSAILIAGSSFGPTLSNVSGETWANCEKTWTLPAASGLISSVAFRPAGMVTSILDRFPSTGTNRPGAACSIRSSVPLRPLTGSILSSLLESTSRSTQGMWVAMTWNWRDEPRGAGAFPNCIATLPSSVTVPSDDDWKSMPAMMISWNPVPEPCETLITVPGNTVSPGTPGVLILRSLIITPPPTVVERAQILMALGS